LSLLIAGFWATAIFPTYPKKKIIRLEGAISMLILIRTVNANPIDMCGPEGSLPQRMKPAI